MDLKKRNIGIFAKGIVHDFGQKVEVFFYFVCLSKTDQEKVFLTFYKEKKPLKTIRTSVYKKRKKIEFFQRGKFIVFVQNLRPL